MINRGQEFHQNLQIKTESPGWVLNRRILREKTKGIGERRFAKKEAVDA
jgi:hypothetical protein